MDTDVCGECGKPAVADWYGDVGVGTTATGVEQGQPMPLCEEHADLHIQQRIGTRLVWRADGREEVLREPVDPD